jgi:hypothetical protein
MFKESVRLSELTDMSCQMNEVDMLHFERFYLAVEHSNAWRAR